MFDFNSWIEVFKTHHQEQGEIYNDAVSYGVTIEHAENLNWKVLGIHHLEPDENKSPNEKFGKHNIYIEVLCKQGDREHFRTIHWTWEGIQSHEHADDLHAGDKPLNELANISIHIGMKVSVWPHLGEKVVGFHSSHPDEGDGNTFGHHSFFACFQEVDPDNGELPSPEPEPSNAVVQITANLDWLNTLPADNQGNITFTV